MANAQVQYHFIPSRKGGRLLCMHGFQQEKGNLDIMAVHFEDMSGSIVNDIITSYGADHNDEADSVSIKMKEKLAEIKEQASTTSASLYTLYREVVNSMRTGQWTEGSLALISRMPTFHSYKSALYRQRQRALPPIEEMWLSTLEAMPDAHRCTRLADYVTTQWIEGPLHLQQWNHHSPSGPLTNNHLERWHLKLKTVVFKAHPSLFQFLDFLKKEQHTDETLTVQYDAGQHRPHKKRKYRHIDSRLDVLKERLVDNIIKLEENADQ